MVDVTHDGDDRRPGDEVVVVPVLTEEVDVERVEQLAVLVLGADDLDRSSRARHRAAAKVSSSSDWVAVAISPRWNSTVTSDAGFGVDLVGEVGQRRATGQPHDGRAVAARDLHAADRRRRHVVELLAPLLLGLPATTRRATGAPEGTRRAAATGTATAAAAEAAADRGDRHRDRRRRSRRRHRRRHRDDRRRREHPGRPRPAGGTGTSAGTTGAAGATDAGSRPGRHHAGVGTRAAGTAGATRTGGGRTRCRAPGRGMPVAPPVEYGLLPGRGAARAAHAAGAARGERVVARARLAGRARGRPGRAGASGVGAAAAAGRGPAAAGRGRLGRAGAARRGRRRGGRRRAPRRRGAGRRRPARRPVPRRAPRARRRPPSWRQPSWRAPSPRVGRCRGAGRASLSLRTTGGSTVDEADRTNSPSSFSLAMTTLLSTPSSLASS